MMEKRIASEVVGRALKYDGHQMDVCSEAGSRTWTLGGCRTRQEERLVPVGGWSLGLDLDSGG